MRRKPGSLVPFELAICATAADLHHDGTREFYGYDMARRLRDLMDRPLLTAYGTLYRALGRLETMGLVRSRWEDPEIPARENRPGRRLYTLTPAGEAAVDAARNAMREQASRRLRHRRAPA
jgi:DNA-binding PadR family transcriptional regulator